MLFIYSSFDIVKVDIKKMKFNRDFRWKKVYLLKVNWFNNGV